MTWLGFSLTKVGSLTAAIKIPEAGASTRRLEFSFFTPVASFSFSSSLAATAASGPRRWPVCRD